MFVSCGAEKQYQAPIMHLESREACNYVVESSVPPSIATRMDLVVWLQSVALFATTVPNDQFSTCRAARIVTPALQQEIRTRKAETARGSRGN